MAAHQMAAATAPSFSDDIIREILVLLSDPADLFRCAVTCKRWRGVVANASFLRRRRWPDDHTSTFFPGFFVWETTATTVKKKKDDAFFAATFIPTTTPRSVLGPNRRSFKSFLSGSPRADRSPLLRSVQPLASRHGLLLVRLDPPDSPDEVVHLAVCNVLVGACHRLPPLECGWTFDRSGFALLTGVDCPSDDAKQQPSPPPQGYSAFFKVLVIGNDNQHRPRSLHNFTSGEASWRGPGEFYSAGDQGSNGRCMPLMNARAVVWRGTAYWLVRGYFTDQNSSWHTIDVDAETCRVLLTKIATPIGHENIRRYDEAQLTLTVTADGKLSLLHMQGGGYGLDVWTRQEDGGGLSRWLPAPTVELHPPRRKMLLMLGEKGGMLIVKDNHGTVYTVDLETGDMEEVMSFDRIHHRQIVPFEMDWPTFFVSRLGR